MTSARSVFFGFLATALTACSSQHTAEPVVMRVTPLPNNVYQVTTDGTSRVTFVDPTKGEVVTHSADAGEVCMPLDTTQMSDQQKLELEMTKSVVKSKNRRQSPTLVVP